jgi:membrane protease YdiL (CAAX protease family)
LTFIIDCRIVILSCTTDNTEKGSRILLEYISEQKQKIARLSMDTQTNSKIRRLLRILRNPFIGLLVLYYALTYVRTAGIFYMISPTISQSHLQAIFAGFLIIANMLLVYGSFAYFIERRPISELALPPMIRELAIGLLLGFGLFTTCILIAMLLGFYRIEGIDSWHNLLEVTGATVAIPFYEELLYRGVVFRILEGVFGGWIALLLSSVCFGLVHLSNSGETLVGIASIALVFGPMLAVPYMVTRRLWIGIGLHTAWNYTMGKIYSGAVSGGSEMQGLFKTSFQGPELLTGGSAGMEGSLIAILVSLTFTVIMLTLAVQRGTIVPPPWKKQVI